MIEVIQQLLEANDNKVVFDRYILVKATPHSFPIKIQKVLWDGQLKYIDLNDNTFPATDQMVINSIYQRLKLLQYEKVIK